jgi:hypothetical protein
MTLKLQAIMSFYVLWYSYNKEHGRKDLLDNISEYEKQKEAVRAIAEKKGLPDPYGEEDSGTFWTWFKSDEEVEKQKEA